MKKIIVFSFLFLGFLTTPFAQEVQTSEDTSWQTNYRAFETKSTDLVHTKLVASFDLFAETIQVERAVRAKLLGAQQGCQEVRNPLHRFRRDV